MIMRNTKLEYIRLRDPLSKVTRSERRTLLGASAIGIVMKAAGLVPTRISALGIEFSQTDQRALLRAFAAIISYFLIAFLVYAASDFLAWRMSSQEAWMEQSARRRSSKGNLHDIVEETESNSRWFHEFVDEWVFLLRNFWIASSLITSFARGILEFIVPLIVGICAIILLLSANT